MRKRYLKKALLITTCCFLVGLSACEKPSNENEFLESNTSSSETAVDTDSNVNNQDNDLQKSESNGNEIVNQTTDKDLKDESSKDENSKIENSSGEDLKGDNSKNEDGITVTENGLLIMENSIGPDENGEFKRASVELLIGNEDNDSFYEKALFAGDSVLNFLYWYVYNQKMSYASNSRWLCANSYSLRAAVTDLESDFTHPMYGGKQRTIPEMITYKSIDKVVLFFGLNDVYYGVDLLLENYNTLTDQIVAVNPDIEIIIIGMTPMYKEAEGKRLNNENIRLANEGILKMCKEKGYGFIDVASYQIEQDGSLPYDYCSSEYDVHQNYTGYDIWMKVLRDYAARCQNYNKAD